MFRPPPNAEGVAGSIGGKPVEWFAKTPSPGAPPFGQQALILQPPGGTYTGPIAHVWIYGDTVEMVTSGKLGARMMANSALERTVDYRGPHPGCQQAV